MKAIKKTIRRIPVVKEAAIWLYKRISPKSYVTYWIDKIATNDTLSILQIGSNDGKTGDPFHRLILKKDKWKAIFVEPVPYIFKRLKNNYPKDNRFIFENYAVNDGSPLTFYWVDEKAKESISTLPKWFDQLGSFNRSNITKHLNGVLEPFIVSAKINGTTITKLLEKNKINNLDILHIDTEGYDWQILSQLDLGKQNPVIILFEHKHLNPQEKALAINFLKEKYYIFNFRGDFLCIRKVKNNLNEKDLSYLQKKCKEVVTPANIHVVA